MGQQSRSKRIRHELLAGKLPPGVKPADDGNFTLAGVVFYRGPHKGENRVMSAHKAALRIARGWSAPAEAL